MDKQTPGQPLVALSFADDQREYVGQVSAELKRRGIETFYDEDHQVDLWGKHLAEELESVYSERASIVIMFVSAAYATRSWPRAERRAALSRAVRERGEYVLPVRFDSTQLEGLNPDIVYMPASVNTPAQLAEKVLEKLRRMGLVAATSAPDVRRWLEGAPRGGSDLNITVVTEAEEPVQNADVAAIQTNGTVTRATTSDSGVARLSIPGDLPVTILVAAPGFAGVMIEDHLPADHLRLRLTARPGGSIIMGSTGQLLGLAGRLNPIRDSSNRTYLYADNIAVNNGAGQPVTVRLNVPLTMEDSTGNRAVVTFLALTREVSLVDYEVQRSGV